MYQAGDYAGAASRFAQGNSAAAHYNRGNALAKGGELEAALDAYEQALERQPDLQPALTNKALVEELLRQREQQQQASPGQSAADSQSGDAQQASPSENGAEQPAQTADAQQADGQSTDSAAQGQQAGGDDGLPAQPASEGGEALDSEQRQAMEQWLRQIPDDPSELLRRKFWYEQQQRQENPR
ncbi:Tetratricopeptide repeat protein [compost metagenome]